MSWVAHAACARQNADLWFPTEAASPIAYKAARAVCETCPVQTDCRDYAIEHGIEYGMWGAMTFRERREFRARRNRERRAS